MYRGIEADISLSQLHTQRGYLRALGRSQLLPLVLRPFSLSRGRLSVEVFY